MRSGRVGAAAQVPCACVPEEVLREVVCSAWHSSLRVDAAAPEAGAWQEWAVRAGRRTRVAWGGPASGVFRGTLQLELVH